MFTKMNTELSQIVESAKLIGKEIKSADAALLRWLKRAMTSNDITLKDVNVMKKELTTEFRKINGALDLNGNWSAGYFKTLSAHISWAVTVMKETFNRKVHIPETLSQLSQEYKRILKSRKSAQDGNSGDDTGHDGDDSGSASEDPKSPRAMALRALQKEIAHYCAPSTAEEIKKLHGEVHAVITKLLRAQSHGNAAKKSAARSAHAQM